MTGQLTELRLTAGLQLGSAESEGRVCRQGKIFGPGRHLPPCLFYRLRLQAVGWLEVERAGQHLVVEQHLVLADLVRLPCGLTEFEDVVPLMHANQPFGKVWRADQLDQLSLRYA
ncbi:hypothetical protein D3C78_1028240 [compost metagenome]